MSPKLPDEILIKIFQQLHQDDQMRCMLVCRRWCQVIESYVLYGTVFIYSAASLKKLLQKVQQRSDVVNKIERVTISIDYTDTEKEEAMKDKYTLLSLLIHLNTLEYITIRFIESEDDIEEKTQYPWHNQIECISEQPTFLITKRLLSSSLCPKLTTLRAQSYDTDLFPILKNAPGLIYLTLIGGSIDFDKLELLHQSLPKLKSLNCLDVYNSVRFNAEKKMIPATSLTECVFIFDCGYEHHFGSVAFTEIVELLVYIYAKYPSLTTLSYDTISLTLYVFERSNNIDWTLLFPKLGPQLKKLCLSFDFSFHQNDLLELLDKHAYQVNDLKLGYLTYNMLVKLPHLRQAFYIQILELVKSDYGSFNWLKNLCVLKRLKLASHQSWNDQINMVDILDHAPPTLESLSLEAVNLAINSEFTGRSNIKRVSFSFMKMPYEMDLFISRSFPQLSELKIDTVELQKKTFVLENIDLKIFNYISPNTSYDLFTTSAITTLCCNNKTRFYSIDNRKHRKELNEIRTTLRPQDYSPIQPSPSSDATPGLTLICNSVRDVIFAS